MAAIAINAARLLHFLYTNKIIPSYGLFVSINPSFRNIEYTLLFVNIVKCTIIARWWHLGKALYLSECVTGFEGIFANRSHRVGDGQRSYAAAVAEGPVANRSH